MAEQRTRFEFTGATLKECRHFVALCLDLDVASQGRTRREAKKMLAEAGSLYLETCVESNVPHLRPVPREDDPRLHPRGNLVEMVPVKVNFRVRAVA
jgi:hypothetical protein